MLSILRNRRVRGSTNDVRGEVYDFVWRISVCTWVRLPEDWCEVGPASRLTVAVRSPPSSRESPVYGTGVRATAEMDGPGRCRALRKSGSFPWRGA